MRDDMAKDGHANSGHSMIWTQTGTTIIEVMVAVVLGMLLSIWIVSAFVSTTRNYNHDEQMGRLQENARFALRMLTDDFGLFDFWGPILSRADINASPRSCNEESTGGDCLGFFTNSSLTVATDCGPGTAATPPANWVLDLSRPVEVLLAATATEASAAFSCIDSDEFEAGTDVLVIKRVRAMELASDRVDDRDDRKVFLRTNGTDAMLHVYDDGGSAAQGANIKDWQYLVHVYYIRKHSMTGSSDGTPALYRRVLNAIDTNDDGSPDATGMAIEDGGVARGVEFVRVLFGIDSDGDGTPNTYLSAPSDIQLQAAVTVRIYILVRAHDAAPGYVNNKTYKLGDLSITAGGDRYYRRVFTTTVKLRNPFNRLIRESVTS